jgi:hypothetical protein
MTTTLELSADDVEHLRFILDSYLSDLRMEIADTERHEFLETLKQREVIKKLLWPRSPETFVGPQ